MLGKIIEINDNTVTIKLEVDVDQVQSLSNLLVIMQDETTNFIGEIASVKKEYATITLLGEMNGDNFVFGIARKPSFNAQIKLVSKEKVKYLISCPEDSENKYLYIGKSTIYDGVNVNVSSLSQI